MKTTIDIADPVLREARKLAAREGTTLRSLVEQALRRLIASAGMTRLVDLTPLGLQFTAQEAGQAFQGGDLFGGSLLAAGMLPVPGAKAASKLPMDEPAAGARVTEPAAVTVVLHCIAADQIDATWPLVEPFFASTCIAVPTTNVKPDWLRRRAEERQALLWAVTSPGELLAAFATELWSDDLCWILSLAGRDMARWFDPVILELADLAKRRGAKRLGFEGRRGWVRPARRLGFALTKTIDLPNGGKLVRMEKVL